MKIINQIKIPDSSKAWKVEGSIWSENGKIIYKDANGDLYLLSDLSNFKTNEQLTEVADSLRINFTTRIPYHEIVIYRNGQRLVGSGNDFLEIDDTSIQLTVPLLDGEVLYADIKTYSIE